MKNGPGTRGIPRKGTLAAIGLAIAASSAGAAAADPHLVADPAFYDPPADIGIYSPGNVIRTEVEEEMHVGMFGNITAYRIMYAAQGPFGDTVAATGMIFVPDGASADDPRDIVVWAHGTVGLGDDCAPSKYSVLFPEGWTGYGWPASDLANAGWVVFAPDYNGLGTPDRVHSWQNTRVEGRATLDGVRATREFLADVTTARFGALGHSQGGSTVQGLNAQVITDLEFVGGVSIGFSVTSTDVVSLFEQTATDPGTYGYFPWIAASVQASVNPTFDAAALIGPGLLPHMDDAITLCAEEFANAVHISPPPAAEDVLVPGGFGHPDVAVWLEDLDFGSDGLGFAAPMLIQVGANDGLMMYGLENYLAGLCAGGATVDAIVYQGATHDGALPRGMSDAMAWLAARFAGAATTSICDTL